MNNAGIIAAGGIEDTSLAQYDRVMRLNMRSIYQTTMLAAPHLITTKGSIVNVSSVLGRRAVRAYAYDYNVDRSELTESTDSLYSM